MVLGGKNQSLPSLVLYTTYVYLADWLLVLQSKALHTGSCVHPSFFNFGEASYKRISHDLEHFVHPTSFEPRFLLY